MVACSPGMRLAQSHRFRIREQVLLHLAFDSADSVLQKINLRQDLLQKEAMMRLYPALQCLPQVGELGSQSPAGQGRQRFSILLAAYHRFEHVASTFAQHIGGHYR